MSISTIPMANTVECRPPATLTPQANLPLVSTTPAGTSFPRFCMGGNHPFFLQTGLQKMREPYILCLEDGLGGRLAPAQPFGRFLYQISQNKKTFLCKPASKELRDKIFFVLIGLKLFLKFEDQSEQIHASVDGPLTKTFAIVQYYSQVYPTWLDYTCTASSRPFLSKEAYAAHATHRKRE